MITQVDATFANGVLTPDTPLPLAEQTRVRVTVETREDWTPEKAAAAWSALQARLKRNPIHSGGQRYTRDELHERD
ncbi:MAG: hypothetical protein ACRC8S_02050 [Fimbriiglobus sp.]